MRAELGSAVSQHLDLCCRYDQPATTRWLVCTALEELEHVFSF